MSRDKVCCFLQEFRCVLRKPRAAGKPQSAVPNCRVRVLARLEDTGRDAFLAVLGEAALNNQVGNWRDDYDYRAGLERALPGLLLGPEVVGRATGRTR